MPPAIITSRAVRVKARTIEAAIRHLGICIEIEKAATLALNQFQQRYTPVMIMNDPLLRAEETRLISAKTEAWNDRFAAWRTANPPTLEDVLWIVAKSGFTKEVAPFMNLSKATRECKNLQRYMREVRNQWGMTQLYYYCEKGMTTSVMRMLEMRSIDVEARPGGKEDGWTCLISAAYESHLDICSLLIDKGAKKRVNKVQPNIFFKLFILRKQLLPINIYRYILITSSPASRNCPTQKSEVLVDVVFPGAAPAG
jgi:hypothetical protein